MDVIADGQLVNRLLVDAKKDTFDGKKNLILLFRIRQFFIINLILTKNEIKKIKNNQF